MKNKSPFDISKIDLSKVDISNDFGDFPPLYKTPEDIEKFILEHNMNLPVLSNLLKLRRENKLDITPTESLFYFDEMFNYVYDVFRVPVEETYVKMIDWLEYIEENLVWGGFSSYFIEFYQRAYLKLETNISIQRILSQVRTPKIINYYKDLNVDYPDYYISKRPELISSFWIKSARNAGQPVDVGDESYMMVHIYPEKVYIMGCDDCSYTFLAKTRQESMDFAAYLQYGAPVWNFNYYKAIHPKLEFTN